MIQLSLWDTFTALETILGSSQPKRLWAIRHLFVLATNCTRNTIEFNECTVCDVGVYGSGQVWQNTIRGNYLHDSARGVFLGPGGLIDNLVDANILENNGMNIVIDGGSSNTIIGNTLNGQGTGIRIGFQSPFTGNNNLILMNSIWNHAIGMYIGAAATGNRMLMNSFMLNTVDIESHGTDWNSTTPVSYFYGPNHRNYLGNYYDSYTGTDTDGDGVGDTDLPFDDGDPVTGPVEYYPLVSAPDQYAIEAWYLHADPDRTMFHRDMTRPVLGMTVDASEQHVWTSDTPASGDVDYPEGTWTGCVSFEAAPSAGDFTLEIGSSSDGTDFTPSGAQASIGGATVSSFETNSAAVSVPDGHYLAVRLTNNTEWTHKLILGGVKCYVSSTGNGDPEWPGGPTGIETTPAAGITLRQNYPNPFNPETTIEFSVPTSTFATLRIYDVAGRYVATIVSAMVGAGVQEARWDGRDHRGQAVGSGIYFYRLRVGDDSSTRKMLLLR